MDNKENFFIKIVFIILIIVFICSIGYMVYYLYDINKSDNDIEEILTEIETEVGTIDGDTTEGKTERILQLEELQKDNKEIIGWLEIEGTNINYPVLQAANNDYYLKIGDMIEKK